MGGQKGEKRGKELTQNVLTTGGGRAPAGVMYTMGTVQYGRKKRKEKAGQGRLRSGQYSR